MSLKAQTHPQSLPLKILIQLRRLNPLVVLVFAALVVFVVADDLVVEDLADYIQMRGTI